MSIQNTRKMVEEVLAKNYAINGVEARNSDIALTIAIWRRFYGVEEYVKVSKLFDLPREDNVKRIRAVIQNEEHRYLPTKWEVAKKRKIARARWEQALGYSRDPEVVARQRGLVSESEKQDQEIKEQGSLL